MGTISYRGFRFPPSIIQNAIWLYLRFGLSLRNVEDLLAERGIEVTYETVRCWVERFGPAFARVLRRRRPRPHSTWHLDEVYLRIDGRWFSAVIRALDSKSEPRMDRSSIKIAIIRPDHATILHFGHRDEVFGGDRLSTGRGEPHAKQN